MRHFLPLVLIIIAIDRKEALVFSLLDLLANHLSILGVTLKALVDEQGKLNGRAAKALSLKLVPKFVLNAVSVLACILGHLYLNLDTNRLEWGNFANVDLLGHVELVFAAREDEVGVVGPLELAVIHENVLLLNRLTRCHLKPVLVSQLFDPEAEQLLQLIG